MTTTRTHGRVVLSTGAKGSQDTTTVAAAFTAVEARS